MVYDTIIFDLDGTLVNTLDDLTESVNTVMYSEGYPLRTLEEVRQFIGEGYRLLIKRSLPNNTKEDEIDRCTALFQKKYIENMLNKTKPYDGILDILKKLKKENVKIGVVSNKMDDATKDVCRFYFGSYIDVAVGDNPKRKKKPAPDNVLAALAELGSSKNRTIYVGDSNIDVQTAKNSGLYCVAVTWGYRSKEILIKEGADYIIDKPDELISDQLQPGVLE